MIHLFLDWLDFFGESQLWHGDICSKKAQHLFSNSLEDDTLSKLLGVSIQSRQVTLSAAGALGLWDHSTQTKT